MQRAERHAKAGEANRGLALQRDALTASNFQKDAFATQVPHNNLGMVRRRCKVAEQDIADIRAGIVMAYQEALALEFGPVDDRFLSKMMALRKRDDKKLRPERARN